MNYAKTTNEPQQQDGKQVRQLMTGIGQTVCAAEVTGAARELRSQRPNPGGAPGLPLISLPLIGASADLIGPADL